MGVSKSWKWEDAFNSILDDDWVNAITDPDERERIFKEYTREAKEKEEIEKRDMKRS